MSMVDEITMSTRDAPSLRALVFQLSENGSWTSCLFVTFITSLGHGVLRADGSRIV